MSDHSSEKKTKDPEARTDEEESLRQEHEALNKMVPLFPDCTGIILRMRSIEKKLNQ